MEIESVVINATNRKLTGEWRVVFPQHGYELRSIRWLLALVYIAAFGVAIVLCVRDCGWPLGLFVFLVLLNELDKIRATGFNGWCLEALSWPGPVNIDQFGRIQGVPYQPVRYYRVLRKWRRRYFLDDGIDCPGARVVGVMPINCNGAIHYHLWDNDDIHWCVRDTKLGSNEPNLRA